MTAPLQAVPLWRQMRAAATALAQIRQGASGTTALAAVEQNLRPGVQALVFHALRHLGQAEALRIHLAQRSPPPDMDALLCLSLTLLLPPDGASPVYDPFTLVDQAVEAAKRNPATRAQSNFLNACLRRYLRESSQLLAAISNDPVATWNHPAWWIARLHKDYPDTWQDILRANNAQPPMTLRVNIRRTTVHAYLEQLQAVGFAGRAQGASGIVLDRAVLVNKLPGFRDGVVSVQDGAAQLAAPLLLEGLLPHGGAPSPLRVLDACAAPGGKTAHLLELLDGRGQVVALDIAPERCQRIHENLQREGLTAQVFAADAGDPATWFEAAGGETFDAILLDAPCTASGIVRRHPDVRWLRREADLAQLAAIQARLLGTLWALLRPGGRLLYCTCSVFPEEGRERIQTFVAHNTGAVLLPSPGHLMPQTGANGEPVRDNGQSDHDGFFYALLGKNAG